MQFYTLIYVGIDLHARSLYACIIDQEQNILIHKEIQAKPDTLYKILEPYIGNIIPSGCEQMRNRFDDPAVQKSIDLDLNLIGTYEKELSEVEWYIK